VALACYPLLLKLEARGWTKSAAARLITIVFSILISVPVTFFIVKGTLTVTSQLERISTNEGLKDQNMQELVVTFRHEIVKYIFKYTSVYDWAEFLTEKKIEQYVVRVNDFLLNFFKGFASSLPELFLLLLVMILCLYSFLVRGTDIRNFFQEIFGFSNERMDHFVQIFIGDSRQVYISNLATGTIQATIVATTISISGMGDFFLIFFITLMVSFIPVVGAAPVFLPYGLFAFLQNDTKWTVIFFVVAVITGLVDNVLRPWLASLGTTRCPPVVSFICVLSGALLLGFPGLFIGILVGSLVVDTLPLFWEELKKSDSFFS
jgi:predicted PurR-regulated permease PerM